MSEQIKMPVRHFYLLRHHILFFYNKPHPNTQIQKIFWPSQKKCPSRHFFWPRHHILFYIKFLVFVSLVHQIMKYRFHLLKCAKLCIPQFTKFFFRPVNIRTKMFFFMAVTSDRDNCAAKFPVKF